MGFFDAAAQGFSGGLGGLGVGLIGGAINGLIGGGGPQLPKEISRLYKLQYGIASQLNQQSNSIPLSMPQEQAALASQRALGGEEFGNQTASLYNAWNPNTATAGGTNDLLQNNANAFQGFQSSVNAQHLLAALNRRQQMKLQASQVAGSAAGGVKDYQQPPDLSGLFGNIARLHAASQGGGMAGASPGTQNTDNSGGVGQTGTGAGPGQPGFIGPQQPVDWQAIAAQGGF